MPRLPGAARSLLDLRTYLHAFRLAHFSSYSHVRQVRRLQLGEGVSMAPNVSFRNAERISIGAGSHLGEHSVIWAGNSTGRVVIGEKCLFAPNVTITASNYRIVQGDVAIMDQPKDERRRRHRRRRLARRERRGARRRHHRRRRRRGGRGGGHEGPSGAVHRRGRARQGDRHSTAAGTR